MYRNVQIKKHWRDCYKVLHTLDPMFYTSIFRQVLSYFLYLTGIL